MKKKEHIIYGLVDPNTKELRYIGYTSSQRKRYYEHYYNIFHKMKLTHKNNWLKSLQDKGQKAELIVLETYDTAKELPQAEIEMIAYYKYIGCTNLTNSTPGGDGGAFMSQETKQKISLSKKGKPSTSKTKFQSKLNSKQISDIINIYLTGKSSYRKLGKIYKVCASTIQNIVHDKFKYFRDLE